MSLLRNRRISPSAVKTLGGVVIVDSQLRIWSCNQVALSLLNDPHVIGRAFADLIPCDVLGSSRADLLNSLECALRTGRTRTSPLFPVPKGDTDVDPYYWRMRRVELPDGPGVAMFFCPPSVMDIERRRRRALKAKLREARLLQTLSCELIEEEGSQQLYERIVEAAAVIMRSKHAAVQTYHPERGPAQTLRLLASRGFSSEAAQMWEWVHADAGTTCAEAVRRGTRVMVHDFEQCKFMINTQAITSYRSEGVRSAATTPLISRSGNMLGVMSVFWPRPHSPSPRQVRLLDILARQAADLVERSQTIEALRRNEYRLREADRRKDEFLAVLAHELRNPLAPIRTGLDIIRRSGNEGNVVEEMRGMMERQVGHMVRLIDDLLDVSRIRCGKIQLHCEPTLFTELLDSAIQVTTAAFESRNVSITVDAPNESLWLNVDPTRFVQILSNVLHNAVKFSRADSVVSVAVKTRCGNDGSDGDMHISVSDAGVGISPEFMPHVFELFTQDGPGVRHGHPGLGIGLALARKLVEMHGGSIEAHSDGADKGSVFTIRMPFSRSVSIVHRGEVVRDQQSVCSQRVLVIDDNADAANALGRLIKAIGSSCRVAYDGPSGLLELERFHPDLVFLDISMPDMNGYEVCRRIRRDAGYPVKVVALTGWGQESDRTEADRAGFDLHLTKPPDPAALETLLFTPA